MPESESEPKTLKLVVTAIFVVLAVVLFALFLRGRKQDAATGRVIAMAPRRRGGDPLGIRGLRASPVSYSAGYWGQGWGAGGEVGAGVPGEGPVIMMLDGEPAGAAG